MKVYFKGHSHFIERSSSYPRLVLFFSYYVIPTAVRELLNRVPGYHKYSSLNQEILRRKLLRMTCSGVDEVHEPPLTLASFYSILLHHVIPNAVRELLNGAPDYHKYSSLNQEILRRKLLRMTCGGVDEVHEPPLTLTSFYSFLPITPRHPDRSEGTPEWGHQAITSIQPQSGDPSSQAPQDDGRWSRICEAGGCERRMNAVGDMNVSVLFFPY